MTTAHLTHWHELVSFSSNGPQPQTLLASAGLKMVLVGLESGQKIPSHPTPPAVYYIIEGTGWIIVNGERFALQPGVLVTTQDGDVRGFEAEKRLVFLGVREA